MAGKHPGLPPLTWLRAFEAAARRLNFTAAAHELGMTQAAVSQHIRLLEAQLNAKLFRRLQRGVELTADGVAYLPHVQSGFRLISRSTRELFGSRSEGQVTVSAPISFASLWLAPRLPAFSSVRPNISVDISTIHVPEDYEIKDADLEIRFGAKPFAGREAVQLTVEQLVPVVSPRLVEGKQKGKAWTGLPRLTLSGGREMWSQWFELAGLEPQQGPSHRFDSFVAALQAAIAGAGVLLGSRPLVDEALRSGRLVRLSKHELKSERGHFATYAEVGRLTPAAQDFLAWLITSKSTKTL
jgi:LysR family transcriptional regulator of beta-lactamase